MFKSILLSLSALAALAAAQNPLFFTSTPNSVSAGQQYKIGYSTPDTNTPVTISIRKNNGDTNNLAPPMTLTSTSTGGSYTWNVPNDIASGSYAFAIDQSGQKENYSGVFPLTGGSSVSSAASSMTSSMTSMESSVTSATGTPSVMSRISASKVSSYPYGASMPSPAGTGSYYGGGMGRNSSYVSPTVPSPTSGSSTGSTGSSGGSGSNGGSNGGSGGSPAAATTTAATGGAASLGSSMALIIGAVAAFAFLN